MQVKVEILYRGDKLQAKREERGLSQGQLAKASSIGVRVIQDYEQGRRDLNGAKLKTILRLCAALECRMSDILNDPETIDLLEQYNK